MRTNEQTTRDGVLLPTSKHQTGTSVIDIRNQHSEGNKNRDIEVLRAIAILLVIFFHWAPHALSQIGPVGNWLNSYTALWSGVDLFFCVSGYVITRSMLHNSDATKSRHFASFAIPFWIRRTYRLWPSAWLWATVPVVLSIWFNRAGLFGEPAKTAVDGIMAILNFANFHFFRCLQSNSCGSLTIYWSLSLEEQFYLAFPFLFYFLGRIPLITVLATIALAQIGIERTNSFEATTPGLGWLIRTDAICLGAIIALLLENKTRTSAVLAVLRKHQLARLGTTIALFAILVTAAAPALHIPRSTGALAIVSAALVFLASFDEHLIFPRIRGIEQILLWVGSRSYSLYLIHSVSGRIAAEFRTRIATFSGGINAAFFGLCLSVILTYILVEANYNWIEMPFRRRGRIRASLYEQDA